jgi:hypothetical protein
MLQLVFQKEFPADYAKKGPWYLSVETVNTVPDGSGSLAPIIDGQVLLNADNVESNLEARGAIVSEGKMAVNEARWIRDVDHGWLYRFNSKTRDAEASYWDGSMKAVWWTSEKQYPYIFRLSDSSWLWYQRGSRNPRIFHNLTANKWESWP